MDTRIALLVLLTVAPTAAAAPPVWGSFDGSRTASTSDAFATSAALLGLRGKVMGAGGVIAPAVATLTSGSLAGVDVFFTGLLGPAGVLAAAEKTALETWLQAGGTLIVTANKDSIAALQSFTLTHQITALPSGKSGNGVTLDPFLHPIVTGMFGQVPYTNLAALWGSGTEYPIDLLANLFEETIATVKETGTVAQGRLLVLGTDALWQNGATGDSLLFQDNVVAWAGGGGSSGCGTTASSSHYGVGHPGTNGVPALTLSSAPILGQSTGLVIGNSAGVDTTTLLLIGLSQASIASGLGGTLLVTPAIQPIFTLPAAGATLPAAVPGDNALCGQSVYMQVLEADAGASAGVSFSAGLEAKFGN